MSSATALLKDNHPSRSVSEDQRQTRYQLPLQSLSTTRNPNLGLILR